MKTSGSAVGTGGIKDGRGAISTASGALQAALWGVRQQPGIYDMQDVLGF